MVRKVPNYIHGKFTVPETATFLDKTNPATGEVIAKVPVCGVAEVNEAVAAAAAAFPAWRETPPVERARYLFRLKMLMEDRFEELSRLVTEEHGKTLAEGRGDVRRGIENVEVACGIPSLMQGLCLEDIARGIDCRATRRPLGVFGAITPFNFPFMVPLWFLPYAVATGNTVVLKPSEQAPLSPVRFFELMDEVEIPPGVVNLVHGAKEVVDSICTHPDVRGVSFVGSSPVAEHVYRLSSQHGKRVQALGGAKNFMVVTPNANLESAARVLAESAFGCAGERCLAAAVTLAVGDVYEPLRDRLIEETKSYRVGNGLEDGVTMGPVISAVQRDRVRGYIQKGIDEGAELLVDGRGVKVRGGENGYFVGPTLFDQVDASMVIAREEIFGPVLCICRVPDLAAAIEVIQSHPMGNTSSIFTENGAEAREFQYRVDASMIGVNVGVPAPMSFFPFGGARGSFYGDLKVHGRDGIEFFTDKKVVIERWFG